jgi:6-phosphogluconolactonase
MVAYVGCYTAQERDGHGEDVNVYQMDSASGNWTHVQLAKDLVNPTGQVVKTGSPSSIVFVNGR